MQQFPHLHFPHYSFTLSLVNSEKVWTPYFDRGLCNVPSTKVSDISILRNPRISLTVLPNWFIVHHLQAHTKKFMTAEFSSYPGRLESWKSMSPLSFQTIYSRLHCPGHLFWSTPSSYRWFSLRSFENNTKMVIQRDLEASRNVILSNFFLYSR